MRREIASEPAPASVHPSPSTRIDRSTDEGGYTYEIRSPPGRAYNPRVTEYFCYMIECADGTFYTGWTTDPERRLKQHRSGYGARYTRTRRPLRLAYLEPQPNLSTAMRREKAIKALPRKKKLALIASRSEEELQSL